MTADVILAILFVIGLILLAVGSNTPASWAVKSGTIIMAVAGVIWLVAGRLH